MSEVRPRILVIEDEAPIRRFLVVALDSHGFTPVEAATAKEGVARATENPPDAILLDLGLPDRDGIELLQDLRGWCRSPIVILSARGREDDKVSALDAGADDYLTKPFGVPELLARLRAVMRRTSRTDTSERSELVCGTLRVDPVDHKAWDGATEIHLTQVEFKILTELIRHAGELVTHRQLCVAVWGPNANEDSQYLRVYIHQIRGKIEKDPGDPKRLITEIGVGYRLIE